MIIGPYDAGIAFVGVGLALLAAAYGRQRAADFLNGCARDLLDDDTPDEGRA